MIRHITSFWPLSWFHGTSKIDVAYDDGVLWDGDVDLTKHPDSLCELIGIFVFETTNSEAFADKVVRSLAKMLKIEDRLYNERLSSRDVLTYKQAMREPISDNVMDLSIALYMIDMYSDRLSDDELVSEIPHFT